MKFSLRLYLHGERARWLLERLLAKLLVKQSDQVILLLTH